MYVLYPSSTCTDEVGPCQRQNPPPSGHHFPPPMLQYACIILKTGFLIFQHLLIGILGASMKEQILNIDYYDLVMTNGSLYGKERIENLMQQAVHSGFTTVLWRISVCGVTACHISSRRWYDGRYATNGNARNMVEILRQFDPLQFAVECAHRYGLKIFAWITLLDEDYDATLVSGFVRQHPEYTLVSRDGERHLTGALCLGYDEVVAYEMQQIKEVSESYDVDGLYLCTRSHAKFATVSRDTDDFGFNDPIVKIFAERYGVDIRTEDFDKEPWYAIQGEGLTRLLSLAAQQAHGRSQLLWVGIHSDALSLMNISPMAHIKLDWRSWIDQGLVDALVVGAGEAVLDMNARWFTEIAQRYALAHTHGVDVHLWFRLWDWRNDRPWYPAPAETKNPTLIEYTARTWASLFDGFAFHEALNIEYWDMWSVFGRISENSKVIVGEKRSELSTKRTNNTTAPSFPQA
jgi:hypothetical protein